MKTLIVVGAFDDNGGRPSSYGNNFAQEFAAHSGYACDILNGGTFDILESVSVKNFDLIIWFANVPNEKKKIVRNIKVINPTCLLVTSKRNDEKKYDILMLLAGALQTKSNLLVEFKKNLDGKIFSTVLDPLGNCFGKPLFLHGLVEVLLNRIKELKSFTRMPSERVGEAIYPPEDAFFSLANQYAEKFHELVHVNGRFLGNLSFRCEKGFPSFRDGKVVFVSKRNIDKREINAEGFVAVDLDSSFVVKYHGECKPSVDTPVQLALYRAYPRIKYMIHGHVYVKNAFTTNKIIPCGALEEIKEIQEIVPDKACNWFFVNLRGHGSLCAAEDVSILKNISFCPRILPEWRF